MLSFSGGDGDGFGEGKVEGVAGEVLKQWSGRRPRH